MHTSSDDAYNAALMSVSLVESPGSFVGTMPSCVATPEDFDSTQSMMVGTAEQFMRKEVLPLVERLDAQEEGLMVSLMRQAGELGLGGPESPESYGGLGLSKSLGTRLAEMMSLNGSFSTTYVVHIGIAQSPISLFGTRDQKLRYLPSLTSCESIGAYALSEPNSGSDALSMSTRAVQDGSDYLVTGTKMWISNAKWADVLTVFAKTEGDRVTAFLVDRSMSGLGIGAEEHKVGLKGSSTARVVLDDVRIPKDNVLYEVGEGHRVAFNALNLGRFKLAAMALGQSREAIHQAAKYAKDRKQFGRPIATFGMIRNKLARMFALHYASESMLYRTGGIVDASFSTLDADADAESNRKACEAFAIEASMSKVFATESLSTIVDEALQIHGGYGYTEEFAVGRLWRDARVTRIYEGTNEINRLFITDRMIKKGLLDILMEASPCSDFHRLLIEAARLSHEKLGVSIIENQQVTACLSDLAMIHYADQACFARGNQLGGLAAQVASYFRWMMAGVACQKAGELRSRLGFDLKVSMESSVAVHEEELTDAVLESVGYPL